MGTSVLVYISAWDTVLITIVSEHLPVVHEMTCAVCSLILSPGEKRGRGVSCFGRVFWISGGRFCFVSLLICFCSEIHLLLCVCKRWQVKEMYHALGTEGGEVCDGL